MVYVCETAGGTLWSHIFFFCSTKGSKYVGFFKLSFSDKKELSLYKWEDNIYIPKEEAGNVERTGTGSLVYLA